MTEATTPTGIALEPPAGKLSLDGQEPEAPAVSRSDTGLPMVHSPVFQTATGTPYLRGPGVVMIARPETDLSGLREFFEGFGPELRFEQYLDDPTELEPGTRLIKTAGQACYASFSPQRTLNAAADRYLENILSSGHGSVLEHANYSLFFYGMPRSDSHEEVRHRAGFAYSQLSQRYVSGRVLRFVERPEFQGDAELHEEFLADIDHASSRYESTAQKLYDRQARGLGVLSADAKTDLRKKVQQAARAKLPNETETFMVVTGNVRAWRHFINMRASSHADVSIRQLAVLAFLVLRANEPLLFADARLSRLSDGTLAVDMAYPKV